MTTRHGLHQLARECASVAAEGTDPARLAHVLGWVVRPRRSPDALRRRCRDAVQGRGPEALVDAMGGEVTEHDASAALPIVAAWARTDVRVALVGDPAYPRRLAEGWPHTDGPVFLAWRGAAPGDQPTVALVGARRATSYGVGVTAWLAEAAAGAGIRVLSGGAVGIDAAAHEAALEGPGGTTVVLGCGHGVAYPRGHARPGGLFDRLVAHGGTVAGELLPHEPPRAGQVRARNRIVAAMADVVVVVEGRAGSGALVTAGAAADRGRTVLAVPGDVRAPGSAAPHQLLSEGAAPCTSPSDLLAALGRTQVPAGAAPGRSSDRPGRPSVLPDEVHRVLAAAWPRPVRLEQLAAAAERPVATLLAAVTRARLAGEVVDGADGVRLRRAPD